MKPGDVELHWSPERKEAFVMYRDLGFERSLSKVAAALGKDASLIGKWSMEDGWVARCAAYDADCDRQRQAALAEERVAISRKHARAIDSTIEVLMQAPVEMARRISEEGLAVDKETDTYTLVRATEAAAKVLPSLVNASRLVHGLSTANVESKQNALEGKTVEELDALLLGSGDDGSADVARRLELPSGE